MKKFILTFMTAMILTLGFAGITSPTIIQPMKELPNNEY